MAVAAPQLLRRERAPLSRVVCAAGRASFNCGQEGRSGAEDALTSRRLACCTRKELRGLWLCVESMKQSTKLVVFYGDV